MAQATINIPPPFLNRFEYGRYMPSKAVDAAGKDASVAPSINDFRQFSESAVLGFMRHPSIIRLVSPRVDTTSFANGQFSYESIVLNDIQPAKIAMEMPKGNTDVTGTPARVALPEIGQTAMMSDRKWAQTIAGQNRMDSLRAMFLDTISEAETVIGFQGVPGLGISGLVSSTTTDASSPTGVWDVDTGSDGRLTNFIKDVKIMKNLVLDYTKNVLTPIDVAMTMPIFQLIQDTVYEETPLYSNLDWLRSVLNGGNVYVSNLIQASVTVNANTFVMIPRVPAGNVGHELIYSGLDMEVHPTGNAFETGLAMREIFSINLLGKAAKQVVWMDAIDCVT